MTPTLALKVDVDTYEGMREGVPNLLGLFRTLGIRASFFVPFGPDESGKAVFRVFKKKGFLKKMLRTNPVKLYGPKTMLRGTLLPAPLIGASFPGIARDIVNSGHELGIHGYNHVEWQDHLHEMDYPRVRRHIELGISEFQKAIGRAPSAFAAPAWFCSRDSFQALDDLGFAYASDTRGRFPFYPSAEGKDFKTLQVPSTLPTVDELLGMDGLTPATVHGRLTREMEASGLDAHVHSIHTEVEGTALFNEFSDWARALRASGVSFATTHELAQKAKEKGAPRCQVRLQELPGRAGPVSCQVA